MSLTTPVKFRLPVLLVLVIGLAVTWRTAHVAGQREQQRVLRLFEKRAEVRVHGLNADAGSSLEAVHAVAALMEATGRIDAATFQSFAGSMLESHAEIVGVQWAPRVRDEQREDFEREGTRALGSAVQITERGADQVRKVAAGSRDEYFPISHARSGAKTEAEVGYDLASDSALLLALTEAGITGQAVNTDPRTETGADGEDRTTFQVVHPVYSQDVPLDTPAQRRVAIAGHVVGEIDAQVLIGKHLRPESSALGAFRWTVYDDGAKEPARLVSGAPLEGGPPTGTAASFAQIGKRTWRILAIPGSGALAAAGSRPFWTILFAGAALSLAAAVWLATALGRKATIARLVEERTPELRDARRTIESQMAEMVLLNEQLQGRNRELGQFSMAVTTGLKQPLKALAARLDWARRELGDASPAALSGIEQVEMLAQHVRRRVDELDELGAASRNTVHLEQVDLEACAERAVRDLDELLDKSGATIRSDELPSLVGDAELITILYRNLIENALLHGGEDQPAVHLTAERADHGWVLGVRDDGKGFQPVPALRTSRRTRKNGHGRIEKPGIGLAICDRVVQRHRGSLWVESRPGAGSHFRFSLNHNIFD
ncbi:MAG TPA: CHASE domain-containing protein [Planctomycetota bacterium]